VRAWEGVTLPSDAGVNLQKGDFLEQYGEQSRRPTVRLNTPNAASHPSNIVFLISNSSAPSTSKLTADQATQLFISGWNGASFSPFFAGRSLQLAGLDAKTVASLFQRRLRENGTNAFVINTQDAKDVQSRFNAVLDNAAKAKPFPNSLMDEITKRAAPYFSATQHSTT